MSFLTIMILALALDGLVGWPHWLFRRIGHPVTWLGALISALDRGLNDPSKGFGTRRLGGIVTVILVVLVAGGAGFVLQSLLPQGMLGVVIGAVLAWPLLAARSLWTHVSDVARPLKKGDMAGARKAVSMIVGRDPHLLGKEGIARASLESLAENASDGVIAPLFWGLVAGLPGIAAYKAINTMDSMIGHKTERHQAFGWAAARLDDLVNLVPARLTGLLFALVSGRFQRSFRIMLRDAGQHRSPNAGWPEGAMAGGLNIRLSGPRRYGQDIVDEPWLNGEAPDPDSATLGRGLALFLRAMVLTQAILIALLLI